MTERGTLELMRHGDTGRASYRGQLDDALADIGWLQMRGAVAGRRWNRIVSSSLRRCADFAHELAAAHGTPLSVDARLVEYGYGDWQGVTIAEIERREPDALRRFRADPQTSAPPHAEPFAAFGARIAEALCDIVEEFPDSRVLVVTHGAVIRWVRCRLEHRPFGEMAGMDVPNASLHRVVWPARAVAA